MDMEILSDIIKTLCCPECRNQRLELKENFSNTQGLASCLVAVCACGYTHPYHTSRSSRKKGFDINRRMIYAMRSCGLGYSGIKRFKSFMNMPRPMTRNNFDKITNLCKVGPQKRSLKSQCKMLQRKYILKKETRMLSLIQELLMMAHGSKEVTHH